MKLKEAKSEVCSAGDIYNIVIIKKYRPFALDISTVEAGAVNTIQIFEQHLTALQDQLSGSTRAFFFPTNGLSGIKNNTTQ